MFAFPINIAIAKDGKPFERITNITQVTGI